MCKLIDSNFKNKYKTEYDDLQKHFKTLVKKPSMQEVLYDVELVIHVKTDDETSKDILENIQNFVSLGRSEDFIELIEAKETEVITETLSLQMEITKKKLKVLCII